MPQAGPEPTTSRRAVLAAGGLSFATGFGALAALPDDRDAALMRDLAEFDRLEDAMRRLARTLLTVADEEAQADRMGAMEAAQAALYARIRATPAQTLAGIRARAASLVHLFPDLLEAEPDDGWDGNLLAAVLRDLVRLPA